MPTRSAKADWQGEFKRGGGIVSTASGAVDSQYNFSGRFESGTGTNPEELLGAAHASCFTMALSVGLTQAGNPPESLATEAKVTVDQVERRLRDHEDRAERHRQGAGARRGRLRAGRPGREGELPAVEGARLGARDHARDELRGLDGALGRSRRRSRACGRWPPRRRVRSPAGWRSSPGSPPARGGCGSRPKAARKRPANPGATLPAPSAAAVRRPDGSACGSLDQAAVAARRDLEDAGGVEQRHGDRRRVGDRGDDLRVVDRAPGRLRLGLRVARRRGRARRS